MAVAEEVTQWIAKLGEGDAQAARIVWERYFTKLVEFARRQLGPVPRRVADEEDVALIAMNSFCQGMAEHRFEQIHDRDSLWKLLLTITARKACAQRRRHFAHKRGGGRIRGESFFGRADPEDGRDEGIGAVLGREPTPELASMVAEDCRRMLDRLDDETLKLVAQQTLEGYSTAEIATKIGCSQRSVQRKLGYDPRDLVCFLRRGDRAVSDPSVGHRTESKVAILVRIEQLCDEFEAAWLAGKRPPIEEFLARGPQLASRKAAGGLAGDRIGTAEPGRRISEPGRVPPPLSGRRGPGRGSYSTASSNSAGWATMSCWKSWAAAVWASSTGRGRFCWARPWP